MLGQQEHPKVRAAVEHCLTAAKAAGKPAGVNAFNPATARSYLAAGAAFVLVGADVAILARGSESLAAEFVTRDPVVEPVETEPAQTPASY